MLDKIKPKMYFNDDKLTLRIGTNKITFNTPKKYQIVKRILVSGGKSGIKSGRRSRRIRTSGRSRRIPSFKILVRNPRKNYRYTSK